MQSYSEIQITQGEDVAHLPVLKILPSLLRKEEVSGLLAKDREQSVGLPRFSMKCNPMTVTIRY